MFRFNHNNTEFNPNFKVLILIQAFFYSASIITVKRFQPVIIFSDKKGSWKNGTAKKQCLWLNLVWVKGECQCEGREIMFNNRQMYLMRMNGKQGQTTRLLFFICVYSSRPHALSVYSFVCLCVALSLSVCVCAYEYNTDERQIATLFFCIPCIVSLSRQQP